MQRLAALLGGVALVLTPYACGDDDDGGPVCGNGVIETGEVCDTGADNGVTLCGCQSDCQYAAFDVVCRAPVGTCDATEFCNGGECPVDGLLEAGTVCRPAAGQCDRDEICTGSSPDCPVDLLVPAGTVCRHSLGQCDPSESCDGTAVDCPADLYEPDASQCTECTNAPCECSGGQCVDG